MATKKTNSSNITTIPNIIKIKTKSGFTCELFSNAADDAIFLEELDAVQNGEPLRSIKAMKTLLGIDGYQRLLNHIRTEDGRAPLTAALNEFAEVLDIFAALSKK